MGTRKPIKLFASDLDYTLVGHPSGARAFATTWRTLPDGDRPYLVYNTGRLVEDTRRLIKETGLPKPDFLICGVGTSIVDMRRDCVLKAFSEVLEEGWNLKKVEEVVSTVMPDAKKQPSYFQTPFKSSWYAERLGTTALREFEKALEKSRLDVSVVYSSSRDLDILPKFADKGNALRWLLKHLRLRAENVLVAGDSGNDSAMFKVDGVRGIIVDNAQPELIEATVGLPVHHASKVCAEGVLEGLVHYGVIAEVVEPSEQMESYEPEIQHLFDEQETPQGLSPNQRDFLKIAYEKAVDGLRRNITPVGFSACSIPDNETRGTDANYHSVWARDGSIALIGSLCLDDEDFRACQLATLRTLLDHTSLTGQIPANVRIESMEPDYSGVGGICSIDSGIWVIIAAYEYVRKTSDFSFLREYFSTLQRAMDWLSAHDSNNDALLEIPEAGDWTDLFGRSYNVLYDEVLWYRANVCFGRLLEFRGEAKRAGDYLRWSRSIKNAILRKFWPTTTQNGDDAPFTFADQQTRLGDTNYLLAQITPFNFDWRLDAYGNILAYLFNVLDTERAKIAFRFMWGVGINEPHPVANLYPPVQAGDPEWRTYYTVNLLNLPNHYHNGGIWPFVGAQWVRFINHLGFRDIAAQELVRVAELNQKGIAVEWEFNEWAHGKTGRPMGKAFQAWSCSEFIHACHELRVNP
ncbi:MAG: HAD-IIB family hydrolase [Opitutales bacterium]|nr:HAD-IIB family hydrolase [Opitutales bacterium]